MTVENYKVREAYQLGDGGNRQFSWSGMKVLDPRDLVVDLRTGATVITLTSGFEVTMLSQTSGSVTLDTAPPAGVGVSVRRFVDYLQTTQIGNQGAFYPEIHERALDRLTMQAQQLAARIGDDGTGGDGGSSGGGGGDGVPEAPLDGNIYGRRSGGWSVVPAGSSGGYTDAEIDAKDTAIRDGILGTKAQPGGIASLNSSGKVPADQLPEASAPLPRADYPTKAAAVAATISPDVSYIRTAGYAAAGDGGGGLYTASTTEPTVPALAKWKAADNRWWGLERSNRNVKAYGVVADGVTDDTTALQQMVTLGGEVYIPHKSVVRLTATISVLLPTTFIGAGCHPYNALEENSQNVRGPGSWFFLNHLGVGFNFVGITSGAGTSGIAVQRMLKCGTYRAQPVPGSGAFTPLNADWDIKVTDCELELDDFVLLNPTKGLSAELARGGRLRLNNVRGQPLTLGISIDKCYDVCHLDVHFWPFWSLHSSVQAWTYANLQALVTGRVDGLMMQRFFCIYANIGWVVRDNGSGTLNRAHADWCYLDNVGKGILIETNVTAATINCAELTVYGRAGVTSIGLQLSGSNCRLLASFADLDTFANQALYVDGSQNRVQFSKLKVSNAGYSDSSTPAVFINSGNTVYLDGTKEYSALSGRPFKAGGGTLVETTAPTTPTPTPDPTPSPVQYGASVSVSVDSAVFWYFKWGREVTVWYDITANSGNFGSGGVNFSLPFTAAFSAVGAGTNMVDGTMNQVRTVGGQGTAGVYIYNNGHPVAAAQNRISGTLTYFTY